MNDNKLQRLVIIIMRKQVNISKTRKNSQPPKMRIVWLNKIKYQIFNVFAFPEQVYSILMK